MNTPRLRSNITPELFNQHGQGYLMGLLGVELISLAPGAAKGRMVVQPHHTAPNGFLHAASVIALADTICGYATWAHLPDEAKSFTTIELKSNFFGTVQQGVVLCDASGQHIGRNTQVWDATVTDQSGRKLALFRCTQMVLWPKE